MRTLLISGVAIFIIGSIVAILDLLDIFPIPFLDHPFSGALALMILGISMIFIAQAREKRESKKSKPSS
jgi:hypothetical protein